MEYNLSNLIQYWVGLSAEDMTMFNVRERNGYVRLLNDDNVFNIFRYVNLKDGKVSHVINITC